VGRCLNPKRTTERTRVHLGALAPFRMPSRIRIYFVQEHIKASTGIALLSVNENMLRRDIGRTAYVRRGCSCMRNMNRLSVHSTVLTYIPRLRVRVRSTLHRFSQNERPRHHVRYRAFLNHFKALPVTGVSDSGEWPSQTHYAETYGVVSTMTRRN
jgi:hypothetical protein